MAASLAALPSMVIFSGTPWRRIAFVRNRLAACLSRSSVRRKSRLYRRFATQPSRVTRPGCEGPPSEPGTRIPMILGDVVAYPLRQLWHGSGDPKFHLSDY